MTENEFLLEDRLSVKWAKESHKSIVITGMLALKPLNASTKKKKTTMSNQLG